MVDSLTFINFQENYQTTEIYFYSYHVTPLNKTISNYCVKYIFPILFRKGTVSYGSPRGPDSDFVFIFHFSVYIFYVSVFAFYFSVFVLNVLIFTSSFCFSIEISVFIFSFSVFVFNVLIFTSSFCFLVLVLILIFYFSVFVLNFLIFT